MPHCFHHQTYRIGTCCFISCAHNSGESVQSTLSKPLFFLAHPRCQTKPSRSALPMVHISAELRSVPFGMVIPATQRQRNDAAIDPSRSRTYGNGASPPVPAQATGCSALHVNESHLRSHTTWRWDLRWIPTKVPPSGVDRGLRCIANPFPTLRVRALRNIALVWLAGVPFVPRDCTRAHCLSSWPSALTTVL